MPPYTGQSGPPARPNIRVTPDGSVLQQTDAAFPLTSANGGHPDYIVEDNGLLADPSRPHRRPGQPPAPRDGPDRYIAPPPSSGPPAWATVPRGPSHRRSEPWDNIQGYDDGPPAPRQTNSVVPLYQSRRMDLYGRFEGYPPTVGPRSPSRQDQSSYYGNEVARQSTEQPSQPLSHTQTVPSGLASETAFYAGSRSMQPERGSSRTSRRHQDSEYSPRQDHDMPRRRPGSEYSQTRDYDSVRRQQDSEYSQRQDHNMPRSQQDSEYSQRQDHDMPRRR